MAPGIFIVPGLYEGTAPFAPLVEYLKKAGFHSIHLATLPSSGTSSKRQPRGLTMDDDIEGIRRDLIPFVEKSGEEGVIMILHSAGGFLGSAAMKGLDHATYLDEGKKGGIKQIVTFTGVCLPVGFEHRTLPFMKIDEAKGTQSPVNPMAFFNDMSAEEARPWIEKFAPHPAHGWGTTTTYAGWKDVPVDYIICEDDQIVYAQMQELMAADAEARVYRLQAGHMPQLSQTQELGKMILEAIDRMD